MDFKSAAFLSLMAMGSGMTALGYACSLPFRVRYERMSFAGLPRHLRGLKILLMADLHGRHPDKIEHDIWPYVLGLDFDMAAICGDVILNNPSQLRPHMKGLSALAKKAPAFYVDGNHEDECCDEIASIFDDIGITSLFDRRGSFAVGATGSSISPVVSICGFKDYKYLTANRFKGIKLLIDDLATTKGFHIILTHQPQIFDLICSKNVNALVLAGHTHGGQIRLPFFPTLVAPGQGILPKYGVGWYHDKNAKLFVTSGIGATTFPLRMFNPPEVVLIELEGQ